MNELHPPGDALSHQQVLLVEDNFLVGLSLKSIIESYGCNVIGPVASVEEGLLSIEQEGIDQAVLDINILGGTSVPIAEALHSRNIPFLFVTGYNSPRLLPDYLKECRQVRKPVDGRVLRDALLEETA